MKLVDSIKRRRGSGSKCRLEPSFCRSTSPLYTRWWLVHPAKCKQNVASVGSLCLKLSKQNRQADMLKSNGWTWCWGQWCWRVHSSQPVPSSGQPSTFLVNTIKPFSWQLSLQSNISESEKIGAPLRETECVEKSVQQKWACRALWMNANNNTGEA